MLGIDIFVVFANFIGKVQEFSFAKAKKLLFHWFPTSQYSLEKAFYTDQNQHL